MQPCSMIVTSRLFVSERGKGGECAALIRRLSCARFVPPGRFPRNLDVVTDQASHDCGGCKVK